jgi:hypothetical protein
MSHLRAILTKRCFQPKQIFSILEYGQASLYGRLDTVIVPLNKTIPTSQWIYFPSIIQGFHIPKKRVKSHHTSSLSLLGENKLQNKKQPKAKPAKKRRPEAEASA